MGLKGNNGNTVTFDKIHLKSLTITQPTANDPKKRIDLVCKRYGLLNGKRVFLNEEIVFTDIDFSKYVTKRLIIDGIIVDSEEMPTKMSQKKNTIKNLDIGDVMIAIEHGIGLLLKFEGKFDYSELE